MRRFFRIAPHGPTNSKNHVVRLARAHPLKSLSLCKMIGTASPPKLKGTVSTCRPSARDGGWRLPRKSPTDLATDKAALGVRQRVNRMLTNHETTRL
jgi:hypothetical protein